MEFNEAIQIIKDSLNKVGSNIDTNEYDGVIVKKLEASNTLDEGRTTNQSHIAITGNQMDIFPYCKSDGYFNEIESDADMKKYFILHIPVLLEENNIRYLEEGSEPSGIGFVSGVNQTKTSIIRSKRKSQTDQIQVSLINCDGEDFIKFRKLLHVNSYLIILKKKQKFEYSFFGVIPNKGIEDDGGLQLLNNKFFKMNTNTIVNVEDFSPKDSKIEIEDNIIEKFRKFYIDNLDRLKEYAESSGNIRLREEFKREYPLDRIKTMTLEEYALGNSEGSLSYKLEFGKYKHAGLGVGGGSATKHGIYKGKDGLYHGYKNAVLENPFEYWEQFRGQLYSFLVDVGTNDDFPNVSEKYPLIDRIPMMAVKFCYLYYPNKFISIGSRGRLQTIIDLFEIDTEENKVSSKMSYEIAKFMRNNISEVNSEDPQILGNALWDFTKDVEDEVEETEETEIETPILYSPDDFKRDVFILDQKYDDMVSLLNKKKNIILTGAPGVGKTFMAKRLAYSIMGSKDTNRVKMIQFHQSYSYEEFIEGYRPTSSGGFKLDRGLFYEFCKKAEKDISRPYYLIIDEINRGNLSKIFGELLMLIESDKRGENLTLAYSKEDFSVPKNLYIIGLMNTADRSLAMMDYALRRRFSFINIEPAFGTEKFNRRFNEIYDAPYTEVLKLMEELNKDIKEDLALGEGFMIGHSYFCLDIPEGTKATNKDIKEILKYEIEPLIDEYWYDEKTMLDKWKMKIEEYLNK